MNCSRGIREPLSRQPSAVPQDRFIFIGVCEFLGGAGPIAPSMTGVKPKLAPFAAFGVTLSQSSRTRFHLIHARQQACRQREVKPNHFGGPVIIG